MATNPLLATVKGYVEPAPNNNKWYNSWAECRGVRARVNPQDGKFKLPSVPLELGENELVVTVTDVSGNQYQQTRTVIKLGDNERSEVFRYDGNPDKRHRGRLAT